MAIIGSLGTVIFEVSANKVKTFDEKKRSGSGRWAVHDIISKKPEPEFLGPGQEQISFTIRLSATSHINPDTELEKLRKMRDTGELSLLILGGKPVSQNFWLVESLDEDQRTFFQGRLMVAYVTVTLKEYPNKKGAAKKK